MKIYNHGLRYWRACLNYGVVPCSEWGRALLHRESLNPSYKTTSTSFCAIDYHRWRGSINHDLTRSLHSSLMRVFRLAVAVSLLVLTSQARALAQANTAGGQASDLSKSICPMIESAARANALPVNFFVRLIWQESRLQPDEIGPLTRTGEHALGIAQFMPGTAIERGLFEPFNPVEALPKSGEFLAELRDQFGNLGLAAAAYNAGPQRVRDYVAGLRDLPVETSNYVLAITGHSVDEWIQSAKNGSGGALAKPYADLNGTSDSCPNLITLLNHPSSSSIAQFELKVPRWCRYLEHPNVSVCGPVHERAIVALNLSRSRDHLPALQRRGAERLQSLHLTGLRY